MSVMYTMVCINVYVAKNTYVYIKCYMYLYNKIPLKPQVVLTRTLEISAPNNCNKSKKIRTITK